MNWNNANLWTLVLNSNVSTIPFGHWYNRRLMMRRGSLPFKDVAGAIWDWRKSLEQDPEAQARVLAGIPADSSPLVDADLEEEEPDPEPDEPPRMRLRSHGEAHFADTVEDLMCDYGAFRFSTDDFAGAAKITVTSAMKSKEREKWIEAIMMEIFSLINGGTLEAVDKVITGAHRVIHSTAQLKAKWKQDGTLDKLKCRLCGCGNELWCLEWSNSVVTQFVRIISLVCTNKHATVRFTYLLIIYLRTQWSERRK
jgi:hypothetical protein